MKDWIPEALSTFQKYMPPINVPYPGITIVSDEDFFQTRSRLVEETGSLIKEAPPDSCLEYLHGDKGNAILINADNIPSLEWASEEYNKEFFCHLLWHELGHFYAINSEPDDLHRFNDAEDEPGMDKERFLKIKRGYWFWSEFIAESISNRVGYCLRSAGPGYHPENIEWDADTWIPVSDKVEDNLELIYDYPRIDEYELAHYFAALLTDDMILLFVQAAHNGKLKNVDGSRCDEEPTYISNMAEELQPPMWEIHGLLEKQMEKEAFWLITQDDVERLGGLIFRMEEALED